MKFENLNYELTTEILEHVGFKYDGYYYVHDKCILRLNKEGDGYKPSFEDPALPQFNTCIKSYPELVCLFMSALNFYIDKQLKDKNFTSDQEQMKYVVKIMNDYFNFDKNLNFMMQVGPQGLAVVPNDEYTYSMVNNEFRDVKVYYKDGEEVKDAPLSIAIQCLSWPFLVEYLQKEYGVEKPIIESVKLVTEEGEVPFFGMGIPKSVPQR